MSKSDNGRQQFAPSKNFIRQDSQSSCGVETTLRYFLYKVLEMREKQKKMLTRSRFSQETRVDHCWVMQLFLAPALNFQEAIF